MRWTAGYFPAGERLAPESAAIEADSSFNALRRLREVIGSDAAVLFIVPIADVPLSETYEAFLSDKHRSP